MPKASSSLAKPSSASESALVKPLGASSSLVKPSGASESSLVKPLGAPLSGIGTVPGDKSISHRAVLLGAMAQGTSHLEGVLDSADVRSSIAAVRALGAVVDLAKQEDGSLAGTVTGWGDQGPSSPDDAIDCGNSGTTTRLLMGVLAPWDVEVELVGDASLCRRPMRRITGPLSKMGATFAPEDRDTLPLVVHGTSALHPLFYRSPVASAQLKTALLLAGIFAQGKTRVEEPAASRNHTEFMLPGYGVAVEHGPGWAEVTGPQTMHACDVVVPGDPSSSAFPVCAAALARESDLTITNISLNAARIGYIDVLQSLGVQVETIQTATLANEPVGDVHVRYTPRLHGCVVEPEAIAGMVDEIPVLSLVAARAAGETVFCGAGELRVKETDRFQAIIDGLAILGVKAWGERDDLHIEGNPDLVFDTPLTFDSLGDHRLAMTWALVGMTGTAPVTIIDYDCVGISYPTFQNDMERFAQ